MPTVALLLWCFFLADILYHMSGAMFFLYVQLDFTINKKSAVFLPRLFFVGKCAIASSAHRLFVA